jgi:sigma-E factor negative regulatory protein RseA
MKHLATSADAQQTWDSYHLVGEVMRSGAAVARVHDPEFVQKLRHKLAQETIEFVAVDAIPITAAGQKSIKITSANDAWWRRVAGFASVALVSMLAWQGYVLLDGRASGAAPQLAQSGSLPQTAIVAAAGGVAAGQPLRLANMAITAAGSESPPVMLRDARLDALLAAHRQFGGTSALQMPSGFLRNATFDEGQR